MATVRTRGLLGSRSFVDDFSADDGQEDVGPEEVGRGGLEQVAVDERHVGLEAGFQHAEAVFVERRVRSAGGIGAEGVLEGQDLLGMPAAGRLPLGVLARDPRRKGPRTD